MAPKQLQQDEEKAKYTVNVAKRESGHNGWFAAGQHFAEGEHQVELTEAEVGDVGKRPGITVQDANGKRLYFDEDGKRTDTKAADTEAKPVASGTSFADTSAEAKGDTSFFGSDRKKK